MDQASGAVIGRATVPARAALAGNPSDGYGGAVVAAPVHAFAATVEVTRRQTARPEPRDADLDALVAATLRAATRLVGLPSELADELRIAVRTTVPRSVGLAGSSAIAIGVLRAVRSADPASGWAERVAAPAALAVVALEAEVIELGIAGGLQDRLVQAHERPVLMDFGDHAVVDVLGRPCGSVEDLPPPPGRFVVAHRSATSASSDVVHGGLARRTDLGPAMERLATSAHDAAAAIRSGSIDALGAAMDQTFEVRASVLDLDPAHVEMVEAARGAGGHANYTGSGGAIVVLCADEAVERAVASALATLPGCTVTRSPFAAPAAGGL